MDDQIRGFAHQVWMRHWRGMREQFSLVGAESPVLGLISIPKHLVKNAPMLKQTSGIRGQLYPGTDLSKIVSESARG